MGMTMVFIKSGQWIVKNQDYVIRTDLGSCVALCLWDPVRKLGGMNHYLLPGKVTDLSENPSHGHYANQSLLYEMIRCGASVHSLQGAIVGGGQLYPENDIYGIGESNAAVAEFVLDKYRIPMVFKRTGGSFSRSVELEVETGMIYVREIKLGTSTITHYQHKFVER